MKRSIILLTLLLAAPLVNAANGDGPDGFGVSPVQLKFEDPALLRGQSADGGLRVQNWLKEPTRVTIEPTGDIASWVKVDAVDFTMDPESSRSIKVTVDVPSDAANGDYRGLLRIRATSGGQPDGSGASVQMEVLPAIRVRVGGEQVIRFVAEAVDVEDRAPDAPLILKATTHNRGNVRAAPHYELVVIDAAGKEVTREALTGANIEPGASREQRIAASRGLPVGSYRASVTLLDPAGGVFTDLAFDIVEGAGGSIPDAIASGTMQKFTVDGPTPPGRLVTFTGTFLNDGTTDIASAKMTVELLLGGKRIAVISSDALRVPAGQTVALEAFHEPEVVGDWTARAYVTYDGIRTDPQDKAFALAGPGAAAAAGKGGNDQAVAPTPFPGTALVGLVLVGAAFTARRR